MKLAIFLTFAFALHAFAETNAQKISLNARNTPLREVMKEIQKQQGYSFLFRGDDIADTRIDVQLKQVEFSEAMQLILHDRGFDWSLDEGIITIKAAAKSKAYPEQPAMQQDRVIRGRVTDEVGNPLAGATVQLKETTIATTTDAEGNYEIKVSRTPKILVYRILGYETVDAVIGDQPVINVSMKVTVSDLDEVVVVGYGTEQKKDLTGAISTLSAKDISERQTVQVSQALQGAMAGVTVTRNSGAPGGAATIRVRGITTIGDNTALAIIDGVPGSLDNLNPNDIESISVLKDGASAAIYGSRAAAGVILVTTKRAKDGQSSLNYTYEFGTERPTQLPEYTDVVRYMQLFNEYLNNDGAGSIYSDDLIANYWNNHRSNPDQFPATNWQDVILKSHAPRHRHDLAFSVGTGKLKTNASLNYSTVGALYDNRDYERYTARVNNDIQINNAISANFDVFFRRTETTEPVGGNPVYEARLLPGEFDDRYEDGRFAPGKEGRNPLAQLHEGGFDDNFYNQLGGRLALNVKPIPALTLTALFAPRLDFNKSKVFTKIIEFTDLEDPTHVRFRNIQNTTLTESRPESFAFNGQFLANYEKTIGDAHHFGGIVGYEENYSRNESLTASRQGFTLTTMPYLNVGSLDLRDNGGSASEVALRSFFGRVKYNFKNKYYIQGNLRLDGSSRFHHNHRWGTFPSFSAAWTLSEEDFLKDIAEPLSFLKIRGSWGALGNERIGNYPYQASMSFMNTLFYRGGTIIPRQTAAQVVYAVQEITWETTESLDIGLDVAMFDKRLSVTADYYEKKTRDILLELDIPSYMGFEAPNQNAGVVGAKGFDFEFSWRDRIGALTYSVAGNLSDSKTKIIDLKGTQMRGATAQIEGYEYSSWFGYRSNGLFQNAEELTGSPVLNNNTRAGDVRYVDINEDGQITPEGDMVPLGGSLPRYSYGGNIRLDYKGFDVTVVFQGVGKVQSRLSSVQVEPFLGNFGNIPLNIDGNFWSSHNTPEQNLAARYPRLSRASTSSNYQMSDFWLINGAYFRMKNVTLGYRLPAAYASKLRMQGLRVYVAANDVMTFHGFPRGWDPEVGSSTYPMVTTVMAGIGIIL